MSYDEASLGFAIDAPDGIFGDAGEFFASIGDNVYGFISAGVRQNMTFVDYDGYFAAADFGTSYSIVAESTDLFGGLSAGRVSFEVRTVDGFLLGESVDAGGFDAVTAVASFDRYVINVFADFDGFYSLRIVNNDIVEGNPIGENIATGGVYSAAIDFTGDIDRFTFFAEAEKQYNISIISSLDDLFLEVEDVFLRSADFIVADEGGLFVFTPAASGIYNLLVSSNGFRGRGDYAFAFDEVVEASPVVPEPSAPPPDPTPVAPVQPDPDPAPTPTPAKPEPAAPAPAAPSFSQPVIEMTSVENVADIEAVRATDVDGFSLLYSISGGEDRELFRIDGSTGLLSFIAGPDHEAPDDDDRDNIYEIEVTATDEDGLEAIQTISVLVEDEGATETNDQIHGADGRDLIQGLGGRDRLKGFQDRDTLLGGEGDDVLLGGIDNDQLRGGDGDDLARGQGGSDRIFGNTGDDQLLGANGEDTLKGGADNDRLVGGGAADRLFGGVGDDTLIGSAGEDRLVGSAGDDVHTGGTGSDRFIFRVNAGDNTITDFESGVDKIRLQNGAERFEDLSIEATAIGVRIGVTGTTITLLSVDEDQISQSDFLF